LKKSTFGQGERRKGSRFRDRAGPGKAQGVNQKKGNGERGKLGQERPIGAGLTGG